MKFSFLTHERQEQRLLEHVSKVSNKLGFLIWNLENKMIPFNVEPGEEVGLKVWNLEKELVLEVWNLEKNSFLMWNLERTTSERINAPAICFLLRKKKLFFHYTR